MNKEEWDCEAWIKHYNPSWDEWMIEKYLDNFIAYPFDMEKFIEMVKYEYENNKYEIKPKQRL